MAAPRTWTELPGAIAAGQGAIWNSFWYATVAATLVLVAGLMLATRFGMGIGTGKSREVGLEPKHHSSGLYRFLRAGLRLSWAGGWLVFLTPGVVLGIALIHAFNHAWSSLFYQSAWIVIVAFTFRYLILGWQTVAQSLRRVDPDLVDVAVLEGATSWQLMRHALWPQIARPAIVAWYIVFVFCLWDVETMILVVPPGGETLALRIFNLLHYGHNTQVNALCLTLLAVAIVPLIFGRTLYLGYLHWLQRARGRFKALPAGLITMALPLMLLTSCAPPSNRSSLPSKLFDRVQIIGTRGVGVGQLNKPRSLAVDGADNLYVVDMTGRVQKFSSNGVFLLSWQMPQTDRGKPKGMGRDRDGNILLVEPHYSRVNVFSPMGKLLAQWGSHGTNFGQLSMPRAVAVNSRGEIFVSEYQEIERVQKYAFEGGDTGRPDHRPAAGLRPPPRCLEEIGHAGTAPGEFNRPEGVCVDLQDRLYVADSCNHRIEVFDGDGRFLRAYGKPGQGPGELSYPYDICVDKEGRQYVCEFGNSRIQVFDPQGHSIEMIGGAGGQPGQFNNPWAVALDSSENLYVADSQNHRVQKLLRRK
jgi:ABC-type spermidine/putrescine transport system permease subunit II/sugar lactone lactonase YvrE